MEQIIVTVTDCVGSFFEDLEISVNIPAGRLLSDVLQTLKCFRPELRLPQTGVRILHNRTGRMIKEEETMEEAGVWNGDYLTLS